MLTTHPQGQPALDYLRGRGFTDATISTFQLGWAPDSCTAMTHALMAKRQMSEADLEGAGLVSRSQRGRGVYDRFRGRIMFPIRDASGGATGLGGRVLGRRPRTDREPGPKYLNSPATLLFDKSRTLYLIDRAKAAIRKQRPGRARRGQHGRADGPPGRASRTSSCSMGTALTAGQVELLTRYAPRIALAYDVDAAGQGAATFGATELTALVGEIERSEHKGRLTDVDVVRLPEGKDPDEVIRDDPETWRERHRAPAADHGVPHRPGRRAPRLRVPCRAASGSSTAVLPTLRIITDPVRRDGYLQLLARRSGVDERVLLEALRAPETGIGSPATARTPAPKINLEAVLASPGALDPQAVERALEPVESSLLRLLLIHPGLIAGVRDRLTPEMLVDHPGARAAGGRSLAAPVPFDRTAFLASLEPTTETVARTLYSLHRPAARDRGRAPPGARPEPADPRAGALSTSCSSSSAPSWPRPRPPATTPPATGCSRTSWSSSDSA